MYLRVAAVEEFEAVRDFYWNLIDCMKDRTDTVGWKKGIYPSDSFLSESIERKELFVMDGEKGYCACVILNSAWNEGYEGLPWSICCSHEEVLVPHALAVLPAMHQKGIGSLVVQQILDIAKERGKKCVRLDILKGNTAAMKLYTRMGFSYVQTNTMFYEDTGWTEFDMYEFVL